MIIKVDRNYLEIKSIKDLNNSNKPSENCNLQLVDPPDFQINKFFYKQIGKDHRWVDRLSWNEKSWIDYVEDGQVKTYILREKENAIGYFEQIFHNEKNVQGTSTKQTATSTTRTTSPTGPAGVIKNLHCF